MRYVEGDISVAPEMFIVHGCNMQGAMNSGVAKALRQRFPTIYEDYKRELPHHELGDAIVSVAKTKVIGNLLTQEFYGYDKKAYADVEAINRSLHRFLRNIEIKHSFVQWYGRLDIASPKIGCGRGGLDWDTQVRPIYEMLETLYGVDFVIYDMPDQYSK